MTIHFRHTDLFRVTGRVVLPTFAFAIQICDQHIHAPLGAFRLNELGEHRSYHGMERTQAARIRLDHSQLMALLAGLDWKKIRPTKVRRPLLTG
ncbi:hypothetical protein I7G59_00065 [Sinorhizobium meliloti]|uniref:hypothetical protein n=1 Tax=Rhizobium meliloti TaxID=382 RepID=UPI002380120D|nr:hypothetical protein [Sinorhizobium meliloti]MDE3795732.1 hypothetical protein [Sinorhizobium meliloti]